MANGDEQSTGSDVPERKDGFLRPAPATPFALETNPPGATEGQSHAFYTEVFAGERFRLYLGRTADGRLRGYEIKADPDTPGQLFPDGTLEITHALFDPTGVQEPEVIQLYNAGSDVFFRRDPAQFLLRMIAGEAERLYVNDRVFGPGATSGEPGDPGGPGGGTGPEIVVEESHRFGRQGSAPGRFRYPAGMTMDPAGQIYVLDQSDFAISVFDPNGVFIERIPIDRQQFAEEGQPQQYAYISLAPGAFARAPTGEFYVADNNRKMVFKLGADTKPLLSFGGTGAGDTRFYRPTGFALAADGGLVFRDEEDRALHFYASNGIYLEKKAYDRGVQGWSDFEKFTGDGAGNYFVADPWSLLVRRLDGEGAVQAEWGGRRAEPGFFIAPVDAAADAEGHIFVADAKAEVIHHFAPDGAFVKLIGSPGNGADQLRTPEGVDVGPDGLIYVADAGNGRVQVYDRDGSHVKSLGGYSQTYEPGYVPYYINSPSAVAHDPRDGSLWVSEAWGGIYRIDPVENKVISKFGFADYSVSPPVQRPFNNLTDIDVDDQGRIYVTDQNRVQIFDDTGQLVGGWGSNVISSDDGGFYYPRGISLTDDGHVYVADHYNRKVKKFTVDGQFVAKWDYPGVDGVYYMGQGKLIVTELQTQKVYVTQEADPFLTLGGKKVADGSFLRIKDARADAGGNVYVADDELARIQKFDSDGNFLKAWGQKGSAATDFNFIESLYIDGDVLYVADKGGPRVAVYDLDGNYVKSFPIPNGMGWYEYSVAAHGDRLYVADSYVMQLRVMDANTGALQTSWTIAGRVNSYPKPVLGLMGNAAGVLLLDGSTGRVIQYDQTGQVLSTWGGIGSAPGKFRHFTAMLTDAAGDLYVLDRQDKRVQRFDADGNLKNEVVNAANVSGAGANFFGTDIFLRDGRLGVVSSSNRKIWFFDPDGTPGESVQLTGSVTPQFAVQHAGGEYTVSDNPGLNLARHDSSGASITTKNDPTQYYNQGDLLLGADDRALVLNGFDRKIRRVDAALETVNEWGGLGSGQGYFYGAFDLAVGADGTLYVTDQGDHGVHLFTPEREYLGKWGGDVEAIYNHQTQKSETTGPFTTPLGVAAGPGGEIYVTDMNLTRLQKWSPAGERLAVHTLDIAPAGYYGGGYYGAESLAVGPSGLVYLVAFHKLTVLDDEGVVLNTVELEINTEEPWRSYVTGIAVNSAGEIFLARGYENRILHLDPDGVLIEERDLSSLTEIPEDEDPGYPVLTLTGIALDAHGRLFVLIPGWNKIVIFDPAGRQESEVLLPPPDTNDMHWYGSWSAFALGPGVIYVIAFGGIVQLKTPALEVPFAGAESDDGEATGGTNDTGGGSGATSGSSAADPRVAEALTGPLQIVSYHSEHFAFASIANEDRLALPPAAGYHFDVPPAYRARQKQYALLALSTAFARPGEDLELEGVGFGRGSRVKIGELILKPRSIAPGRIAVTLPAEVVSAPLSVFDGLDPENRTVPVPFAVFAQPEVYRVTPLLPAPGSVVGIYGINLKGEAEPEVFIGDLGPLEIVSRTARLLEARVPEDAEDAAPAVLRLRYGPAPDETLVTEFLVGVESGRWRDLLSEVESSVWRNDDQPGANGLRPDGGGDPARGRVRRQFDRELEDGSRPEEILYTLPPGPVFGFVQGEFASGELPPGSRLYLDLGFRADAADDARVVFSVHCVQSQTNTVFDLLRFEKTRDGSLHRVELILDEILPLKEWYDSQFEFFQGSLLLRAAPGDGALEYNPALHAAWARVDLRLPPAKDIPVPGETPDIPTEVDPPVVVLDQAELDFGLVEPPATVDLQLSVSNAGEDILKINEVLPGHSAFVLNGPALPAAIRAGEATLFHFRYAPAPSDANVAVNVNAVLKTNDPATPEATVALKGEPALPGLVVETAAGVAVEFGAVDAATLSEAFVTLRNDGRGDLVLGPPFLADERFAVWPATTAERAALHVEMQSILSDLRDRAMNLLTDHLTVAETGEAILTYTLDVAENLAPELRRLAWDYTYISTEHWSLLADPAGKDGVDEAIAGANSNWTTMIDILGGQGAGDATQAAGAAVQHLYFFHDRAANVFDTLNLRGPGSGPTETVTLEQGRSQTYTLRYTPHPDQPRRRAAYRKEFRRGRALELLTPIPTTVDALVADKMTAGTGTEQTSWTLPQITEVRDDALAIHESYFQIPPDHWFALDDNAGRRAADDALDAALLHLDHLVRLHGGESIDGVDITDASKDANAELKSFAAALRQILTVLAEPTPAVTPSNTTGVWSADPVAAACVFPTNVAGQENLNVALRATPQPAGFAYDPVELVFGPTRGSTVLPVRVGNPGTGTLEVTELNITDGDDAFAVEVDELPFWLAPGASIDIDIRFTPVELVEAGRLEIVSRGPERSSVELPLVGEGIFVPPGTTWTQLTADHGWGARREYQVMELNDRFFVMGGESEWPYTVLNDVWSTGDGALWTKETDDSGIQPPRKSPLGVHRLGDRYYLIGGYDEAGDRWLNDVWSSGDCIQWTRETDNAGFPVRTFDPDLNFHSFVLGGRMFVMGGYTGSAHLRDVWSSADGVNWRQETVDYQMPLRTLPSATFLFDDKFWIIGGYSHSNQELRDVWYTADGQTWTMATGDTGITSHARQAIAGNKFRFTFVLNGRMYIGGGRTPGYQYLPEVWSSADGATWTRETDQFPMPARHCPLGEVVLGDRFYLIGGTDLGNVPLTDIWSTADGRVWEQVTETYDFPERHFQFQKFVATNVHRFGDSLLLIGGRDPATHKVFQDVWVSEI